MSDIEVELPTAVGARCRGRLGAGSRERHRQTTRQDPRGPSERPVDRPHAPLPPARASPSSPGERARSRGHSSLERARARQAVTRLWPGALRHRPAITTASTTTSSCRRAHFSDDDLVRIDAEMRAIIAETTVHPKRVLDRRGTRLFEISVQQRSSTPWPTHERRGLAEVDSTSRSRRTPTRRLTDLCRGRTSFDATPRHFKLTASPARTGAG